MSIIRDVISLILALGNITEGINRKDNIGHESSICSPFEKPKKRTSTFMEIVRKQHKE